MSSKDDVFGQKISLRPNQILQIDATIIAGIFIFLTIGSIGDDPTGPELLEKYLEEVGPINVLIIEKTDLANELTDSLDVLRYEIFVLEGILSTDISVPEKIRRILNDIENERNSIKWKSNFR